MPEHPDREQLAAFQAGDGDRRQLADVAAHLAGCPSCAAVVASVERARGRLALLEEPDLPPGLHDRLVAATEAEAAKAPATRPASRFGRVGSATGTAQPAGSATGAAGTAGTRGFPAPGPRPIPWYRRRVAWAAAAALLLAALVAVPLLDQTSDLTTSSGAGGGQDVASPEAAGPVPLLRVPGEVSAASVRASLASDTRAKAALDAASKGARGTQSATPGGSGGLQGGGTPGTSPGSAGTPGGAGGGQAGNSGASPGSAGTPAAPGSAGTGGDTARPLDQAEGGVRSSAPAALLACLPAATAATDPATRPLTPAFFLEGSYRGRAATVLVTASTGQPGRVDLWVFPRDSCSGPPLATERVR